MAGDAGADGMFSWMLVVTSSPDGVRLPVVRGLGHFRRPRCDGSIGDTAIDDHARRLIAEVCERRIADRNTRDRERVAVRAFGAKHAR